MKRILLATFLLISAGASAQTVNLLKDIHTSLNAAGSNPSNFTNVGGTIVFTANDPEHGTELWKTDGTLGGTVIVKDINQGSGSSSPSYLAVIGSVVYFAASDGINGSELWKSDGTANGTVMVKDIYAGGTGSFPAYIIAVGSSLYFAADNGSTGKELWKSDGTSGNTVPLGDIYLGATGSNPAYLTNANGTVYFRATHGTTGTELYKTTGGAPSLVEDLYTGTGNSSSPYNLIALNAASSNIIFFVAYDATNGYELWKSDGTSGAGTAVQSIYRVFTGYVACGIFLCATYDYSGSSYPEYFASTGSYVYFAARSSDEGNEVWKHDGTSLTLVEDEVVGTGDLDPAYLTAVGTTVIFSGNSAAGDRELYKVNPSTDVVELISAINGSGDSNPIDFEPYSATQVFFTATAADGPELFKATTSIGSATQVANINTAAGVGSSPTNKAFVGGKLYMSASNGTSGAELWKSDGTGGGTVIVKDINAGSEDGNPSSIFNTGTTLYFAATTAATGSELWKSDGTSINTVAVVDVNALTPSSSPVPFAFTNSLIQFRANTATKGNEFHVSTGAVGNVTLKEINLVNESGSDPGLYGYVTHGSSVYFTAYHPTYGYELWKSVNGATATLVGTEIYAGTGSSYPQNLTVFGSYVYFSATDETTGTELFRTNVGLNSIEATENLNAASDASPSYLCVVGSTLYFSASNGSAADGFELFKTTSTTISIVKTGGINPGTANSSPAFLTNVNGTLFFRATEGTNGVELWKSDGTSAGTVMVKDINTTPGASSSPANLTAVGSILYFSANESINGTELYKSDGTLAGTVLVKDILLGTASSSPSQFKNINGTLYFSASNGAGVNLMKTNGTTQGTIVATSVGVITYQGVSQIQYLSANSGSVYWAGTTNTYGNELLYIKAEPLNQPLSLDVITPTATTLTLSWPSASGATGYIVIRNPSIAPTALPVDGVAPSLGTTYTSGTGAVAFVGVGNGFTDTGLLSNTTYHYKIYSYVDGGSSVNIYKPHLPPSGSNTTMAAEPTVQTSNPTFNLITSNSMTVGWTEGDGAERIVIARAGSAVSIGPSDAATYTASATYGAGSALGGGFVVYKGSGNSVVVDGLTDATVYHFYMVELNGAGSQTNYLITSPLVDNAQTLALNGNQPTDLDFTSVGTTTMTVGWTAAGAGPVGYIVIRGDGVDPAADPPVNMTPYSAGNAIGSSTVAYFGSGTGFNETTLTAGHTYYYRVYSFNGTLGSPSYVFADPLGGSQTMFATEPTGAPGPITFDAYTTSLIGVFTAGTPDGSYIVLEKSSAVSPDEPIDGTTYAVGNSIGGSRVVFVGLLVDLPFTSSGLTPNTIYHYAAFSVAGTGAATNYLTSSSSVASRTTLVDEPVAQPSDIVFDNLAPSQFDVSFTGASTVPDGYIVLLRTGVPVTPDAPVDGVVYGIGDPVGASASVAYVGTETTFLQTGLASNTTYHFAVFSYMGTGDATNYLVAGPATASQVTPASEPSQQPTAFAPGARNTTSLSFSFTAAATAPVPDGYLVLRSSGGAPIGVPEDGIAYSPGGPIGPDVVVQVGNSVSVVDDNFGDDLIADTHYYYAIFSYNGTTGTYNYRPATPLQGDMFTLADEPVDHPINMAFSNPATTSMTVAWDEPASIPGGYLVLRKNGSAIATGVPVDGTTYVVGQPLGDGTVAYIGDVPFFNATGLTAQTVTHFKVFPYKGAAASSNFLTAPTVLIGSRTTLAAEPVAQPTSISFSNKSTSTVDVNFTVSAAPNYLILRRAGSAPIETPVDGVEYADNFILGASVITYTTNVAGLPFTDGAGVTAPMSAGITYHYAVFGYSGSNGSNNYLTSLPLINTIDLLALEPASQPTVMTFSSVTGNSLTGNFTAAAGSPPASGYLVVRKQGGVLVGSPNSATVYTVGQAVGDGVVVHSGSATTFDDSGLDPEVTYYYTAFSYNGNAGSRNYLTSSPLEGNQITLGVEPSQPTNILFSSITTTTLSITFTESDADRYLILRKAGTPPTDLPADGQSYTAGTPLGASDIVFSGTVSTPPAIPQSGLTAGTQYHYKVYGYSGSAAARYNYNTVAPLSGSVDMLAPVPSGQPSVLVFSSVTANSLTGTFTAASGPPAGYLVVRKAGGATVGTPANAIAYAVDDPLGDGTVVHSGPAVTFNDSGLSPEVAYHYTVYSFNGSGGSTTYRTSAPLLGNRTTLADEPVQPTGLGFSSITTNSCSFNFTESLDADHYLILRKAGTAPTETPADGTSYVTDTNLGGSYIVLAGDISALPIAQTGLTAGTTYHYAIYAYNGSAVATYNYNITSPLIGQVNTITPAPTSQPTTLTFSSVTINSLTGTFIAAAGPPSGYLVVRRAGGAPTGIPSVGVSYAVGDPLGNGTVVHSGAEVTFDDAGLLEVTVYHYKVFAFNGSGTNIAYLTTSPLAGNQATADSEPNAQPTSIAFTNLTSTSVSVGFTPSAATGFLILRKPGAVAPTEVPVDGTDYPDGDDFGSSVGFTIITSEIPLVDAGLSPETQYSYAVYAFNTNSGSNNYLTTPPLNGTVLTPGVPPAAGPTNVTFTAVDTETATVSFTPPAIVPDGYIVIRKAVSAPTGTPANGTAYVAGDPVGDGEVAYVGTATSFIDTGLSGETDYYYEVYAFNGTDDATSYQAGAPASGHQLLPAWQPLRQATLLTFTNVTPTGFTVGFTPDPDEFSEAHIVIRKLGSDPTGVPADGTAYVLGADLGDGKVAYVGAASSFNETLALGAYHYAVYAFNGPVHPAAINYNPNSPLRGTVPVDTTPPTFVNSGTPTTIASGQPLTISFKVEDTDTEPDTEVLAPVKLEYRALATAQGTAFTEVNMDDPDEDGVYVASLAAAIVGDLGVVYRIKASNKHNTPGISDYFRTLVSLNDLTLPTILAGSSVEDYRIIAVPLALSVSDGDKVFEDLGDPGDGKNWRMYRYENGATTEITSLTGLNVAPGKGYWLISKNQVSLSTGGGIAVDVTETTPFTINLTSGWNQIGNPYLFNINWSDVNTENLTDLDLVTYNGGFDPDTKLNKYEGGFVSTDASGPLKIPAIPGAGREAKIEAKTNPLNSDDWEVVLNLRNGTFNNTFGGVGMSRDAKVGYDHFDNFTLPRFFNYVELNHYKTAYGMTYTKDIQPLAENHTWEFAIEANKTGTTEMTWDNSYFGNSDRQIVLWDEEEQQAFDMREHSFYSFQQGVKRKFKIFFGDKGYVDEKIELLSGLRIHTISPNPSSSDVRVAFSLPGEQSSHVQVRVVNGMGQQVVSIFEGVLNAGYNEVSWSGKEVNGERPAYGVYLVELISGEKRVSKRLVIK